LGQMFFDISALANYFIGQKDQANSGIREKTDKSGSVSFEDFLASLSGQEISRKQESDVTDSAFALPVLSLPQVISEPNGIDGEVFFDAVQKNINPNPNQTAFENFVQKTNEVYPVEPIETFEALSIPAYELKNIVKSQAIAVTLNLDKCTLNTTNTDLNFLSDINQVNNPTLSIADIRPGDSTKANQAETSLTDNLIFTDQVKSLDLSSYTKLSFTIDNLLIKDRTAVDVKAFDPGNNLVELKAPVGQLKQIVENYPDNIIAQIKPGNSTKESNLTFASIPAAEKTEKYILFDLKSLILSGDLDKIKIVHKTVINSQSNQDKSSANSDIDLLNNLRSNKTFTLTIKDNSILHNKIIEPNETPGQPVAEPKKAFGFSQKDQPLNQVNQAGTQDGNNSKAEFDRAEKAAFDYSSTKAGESVAKAGEVAQISKGVGSSSNQTMNEINSVQQLNLKTSDTPIDFKNAESLPGKSLGSDNIEIAEKIIGQIKSKMTATPEYTRMTIDLKPESLGKIKLDFEYEGEKIKALLQVDNLKVKSILDADLPRLKSELKIDSIKVEITLNDFRQDGNAPNQRSHFAKYENNHLLHHPKFSEQDEIGGKISSEAARSAEKNVYHGGIINLLA